MLEVKQLALTALQAEALHVYHDVIPNTYFTYLKGRVAKQETINLSFVQQFTPQMK